MTLEISEMTAADCLEVRSFWEQIEGVGLNESDTPENLAIYFDRNPGLSLIARDQGRLVGAVLCGQDGRRGYLHHLAVAPERRKQGLGRLLIERCLSTLAAQGITRCNIYVYRDNHDGSEFWLKHGWFERSDLNILQRVILPESKPLP